MGDDMHGSHHIHGPQTCDMQGHVIQQTTLQDLFLDDDRALRLPERQISANGASSARMG
jgi:hypothetical protein